MVSDLESLPTPAFLVDRAQVRRNTQAMLERARAAGVALRPHVKTHKTKEIARLQVGGEAGPITVSTLAEARFFLEAGFRDLTYAFPFPVDRAREAAALARRAERLHLVVDHPEQVRCLSGTGRAEGVRFHLLLKVDAGARRAGVDPSPPAAFSLARAIHGDPHLDFAGILTHAGQAYACRSLDEVRTVAEKERALMAALAGRLREAGIPCPVVSAGSTPAAVAGTCWDGVTELRPGNYVFFDAFQAAIGVCTLEACAAVVLATVVSHYPERNRLLVNAGALALSKDRGAAHLGNPVSFGVVQGHPELRVAGLSQEHGVIEGAAGPLPFDRFPVGARIRIVPNHSCLAAACFDRYHVIEGGAVVDTWFPARGW